jgi:multimeric flavodoxin WrbA
MDIKDFENFMNESWTDEDFVITKDSVVDIEPEEEIKAEPSKESEGSLEVTLKAFGEDTEDEIVEELPVVDAVAVAGVEANTKVKSNEEIGTQLSTKPEKCDCKTVILNGVVSSSATDADVTSQITSILKEKIAAENTIEINLFQLNIQPVNDGEEPLDGMVQVYNALAGADIVILATDIKKGQISSVLQTTMERLSNHFQEKELRNVVFGSVVAGEEDSHQNVKSNLINFANNMGMIIGGDCHVYCCAEEGKDCSHEYEADTTTAATCLVALCCATQSIRCNKEECENTEATPSGELPTLTSTIKTYDEFEKGIDSPPIDNGLEEPVVDKEEREISDSQLEEDKPKLAGQMSQFAEEEEVVAYDYENNLVYNPLETPMHKQKRDIALELPDAEDKCEVCDCKAAECRCEGTCESIMDFIKFLG